MTFPRIAKWLNDNGYKTPRRHTFTSSHAHSIYIKSETSSDRYGKTCYSQLKDIKVSYGQMGINHTYLIPPINVCNRGKLNVNTCCKLVKNLTIQC